jgi:hypothetical protein
MKTSRRALWLMPLTAVVFCGAAFVTLRAAGQAALQRTVASLPSSAATTQPKHPAPSTPEESATIADDPTTAPDPSQSADNDISFPTDI